MRLQQTCVLVLIAYVSTIATEDVVNLGYGKCGGDESECKNACKSIGPFTCGPDKTDTDDLCLCMKPGYSKTLANDENSLPEAYLNDVCTHTDDNGCFKLCREIYGSGGSCDEHFLDHCDCFMNPPDPTDAPDDNGATTVNSDDGVKPKAEDGDKPKAEDKPNSGTKPNGDKPKGDDNPDVGVKPNVDKKPDGGKTEEGCDHDDGENGDGEDGDGDDGGEGGEGVDQEGGDAEPDQEPHDDDNEDSGSDGHKKLPVPVPKKLTHPVLKKDKPVSGGRAPSKHDGSKDKGSKGGKKNGASDSDDGEDGEDNHVSGKRSPSNHDASNDNESKSGGKKHGGSNSESSNERHSNSGRGSGSSHDSKEFNFKISEPEEPEDPDMLIECEEHEYESPECKELEKRK